MKKDDPVAVRIEDVGQAIGRTAAHEVGHSLGLVGTNYPHRCSWMNGCDGGHSCDAFDASHPLANRFADGWFIMDPGGKTLNRSRIGEPSKTMRAAVRRAPRFDNFGASYLRIVHPPAP